MKTNTKKFRLIKDKELRDKFLADQIKIGLRYQLRSLRDSQGLTQKDLADLIGTKQSVISRLERNAERVSIPTLLDIAEALDVGVIVRFESIDTVLDWYNNSSQKKMTPRKSKEVLKELEEQSKVKQESCEVALKDIPNISSSFNKYLSQIAQTLLLPVNEDSQTFDNKILKETGKNTLINHAIRLSEIFNAGENIEAENINFVNEKKSVEPRLFRRKKRRVEKTKEEKRDYIPTLDYSTFALPN
jgi:transcriptional regulator with XRE-family HTH domain